MTRCSGLLGLAMGLVLALGGAAHAKDLCISYDGGQIALKNFRIPAKNACKSIKGRQDGRSGFHGSTTGAACTFADGSAVEMTGVTASDDLGLAIFQLRLALPSLTGSLKRYRPATDASGGSESTNPVIVTRCSAPIL